MRPGAAVEAVAPDHDPLTGPVRLDVVGPGRGERSDPFGVRGKRGRNGAHERGGGAMQEVGRGPGEPDGQSSPTGYHPGRRRPLPGNDVGSAHDVARVLGSGGIDARSEGAVDGACEGARTDRGAVAESESVTQREGVRPPVGRDLRESGGHLGNEAEGVGRRLVRVREKPCARGVEHRPARHGGGKGGIDVVEPGRRVEADAEDAAFAGHSPRARQAGLGRDHGHNRPAQNRGQDPPRHSLLLV